MQVCVRFMEREMDKNRVFTVTFLKQLAQSFQTTVKELASAFQTTVRQEVESTREMLSSLLQQQPQQAGREATSYATPTPAKRRRVEAGDPWTGEAGAPRTGAGAPNVINVEDIPNLPPPPFVWEAAELTDGRLGGLLKDALYVEMDAVYTAPNPEAVRPLPGCGLTAPSRNKNM